MSGGELGLGRRRRRRRSHGHKRYQDTQTATRWIWMIRLGVLFLVGGGVFWFVSEAMPKRGVIEIPSTGLPDELLPSLIRHKQPAAKDTVTNNGQSSGAQK
jgi:hypothetical protein